MLMSDSVRARVLGGVSLLCALGFGGCPDNQPADNAADASQTGTQLTVCDPLAAHELPITLGNVIAAGKDASGTLFVATTDPIGSEGRVFVSDGDTLYRKRVDGGGTQGTTDFEWDFEDGSSEDLATDRRLVVQKMGDQVTGIALAPADQKSFFDSLDASAEPLTAVDPSTLSDFKVRNLPGEILLAYVANVEDGSQLVVTRPRDDWAYGDFRVFYGKANRLVERVTSDVSASRSSVTDIDFQVDGASYHAVFTSVFAPTIVSSLDAGGTMLSLQVVDPPVLPANIAFQCLTH